MTEHETTPLTEAKQSGGWIGVEMELSRRMDRLGYSEWERDLWELMAEMRTLVRSEADRHMRAAEDAAREIKDHLEGRQP